ncbi:MAG TPA: RidA family protein [Sphingomicrobium sp.]|nr:RidA family protein [Sphingomicrobium sp.]
MSLSETFHLSAAGEQAFGYAQAVRSGSLVHVSGTLSVDETFAPLHAGQIDEQVRHIYASIRRTLDHFGIGLRSVVRETIYVTDMEAFLGANSIRLAEYDGHYPAATAVQVQRLAFPECMIEVEVTADLTARS